MRKILKGFTLIELLIVIAIIGILTVAFLPNALNAPKKARDAGKIKGIQDVKAAVEAIYYSTNKFPAQSTSGLVNDTVDSNLQISVANDTYYYCTRTGFYAIGATMEHTPNANSKAGTSDFTDTDTDCALAYMTGTSTSMTMYVVTGP